MFSTHTDSIAHANDIASLQAWKDFTFRFWEDNAPTIKEEQSRQLFHSGFYRSRAALYDLTENDLNAYLSDYQSLRLQSINQKYQTVLSDRVLCGHVLANYFDVEKNICIISKNGAQWLESPWWATENTAPGEVHVHSLAPDSHAQYRKIKLAESSDSQVFQKAFINQLVEEAQEHSEALIISTAPVQHRWLTKVSPAGYHLLHVLLVREPDEGLPEIAAASLTIGSAATLSSTPARVEEGALSASINPQTGLITACRGLNQQGTVDTYLQHPDTAVTLVGEHLPSWEAIRKALLRFFDQSSYLHVCSLSFVVTETGVSFFGTNTDVMAAHQMHQPLLEHASIAHHLSKVSG
ncbi:sugar-transfer associated ATP-grasp domain-containing protein [Halomonas sp. AOP35-4E-18]|uniref:sugar-transfer associated ATP-grasp domain-containing protein n=1 Tax=Halomonas sp. AOP35-4E-18 TaxID=3457686 RepID=UPI0040339089